MWKRYWFRILSIVMCSMIMMGGVLTYWYMDEGTSGKKAEAKVVQVESFTKENPLTLYEIVPYMMYAEIGYLIDGGETVSYEKMEEDTEKIYRKDWTGKDMSGLMRSFGGTDAHEIVIKNESNTLWAFYSWEHFKRNSVIDFIVSDALITKRAIRRRLEREIRTTTIDWHRKNCEETLKDYSYTKEEEEIVKRFDAVYVVYKALLVSDVNADMEQEKAAHILDNADIIFMTGGCASGAGDQLKKYLKSEYKDKLKNSDDSTYLSNMNQAPFSYDVNERLSWKSADKMYQLASRDGGTPVIMDHKIGRYHYPLESKQVAVHCVNRKTDRIEQGILVGGGSLQSGISNNAYKLYLMLYQRDPIDFREKFYPHIVDGNITYQEGEAQKYWNPYAFYEVNWYDAKNNGQNINAYGQIFLTTGMVWNSDSTFVQNFITEWSGITIPDSAELTYMKECYYNYSIKYSASLVTDTTKKKLNMAECLQHLVANRKRQEKKLTKTTIKVLDLEPSNEFTLEEAKARSYLGGFKGELEITSMTSAQFNSTKSDLAGTFDLLYMGANAGGLNISNTNKNIYRSHGDMVNIKSSGESKECFYPGNDITKEKKAELTAYLAAGRPIIMADTIYNKERMDQDSYLYQFVNKECKSAKERGQLVKESSMVSAPGEVFGQIYDYLNAFRPALKNVTVSFGERAIQAECMIKNHNEAGADKELTATLSAIAPNGEENTPIVIGSSKADANGLVKIKGNVPDEFHRAGAVTYLLKVESSDQERHYGVERGTVKKSVGMARTIRVLQVAPETNGTLDISDGSTVVGKLLQDAPGENLVVTKLTTEEFGLLYDSESGGTPYQKEEPITNALSGYDVIVFGASANYPVIQNKDGALDNVISFIHGGRSVIFTNGVLDQPWKGMDEATKGAYQTLRSLAGIKGEDSFTYPYLTKNRIDASAYTLYNISGSDLTKKAAYETDRVTKVNEAPVSSYPYAIGHENLTQKTSSLGVEQRFMSLTTSKTGAGAYFLDTAKVTGYYALCNEDAAGRKMYSASPNDIQNNYYLYQSGRVWYSGIGNAVLSQKQEEEGKLFVNTILAAYESGKEPPAVSFVGTTKDKDGYDLAFVDADVSATTITSDKLLSFLPFDKSGKKMKTSLYVKGEEEMTELTEVLDGGRAISLKDAKLASGTTYELIIPAKVLNQQQLSVILYVENENGWGRAECKLIRRNEFDLD